MIPAREWAKHDANFLAVILESSSTLIVVSAIEPLTFSMVPLEFTHGIRVWQWNRLAWFAISLTAAFLFWHVLIVQKYAGFNAIGKQGTLGALAALGVCVGLTASVWGFFYCRHRLKAKMKALAAAGWSATGSDVVASGSEPSADASVDIAASEPHPDVVDAAAGPQPNEAPVEGGAGVIRTGGAVMRRVLVLVGTRKGAWIYASNAKRERWELSNARWVSPLRRRGALRSRRQRERALDP